MILEVVILMIRPGEEAGFESALRHARPLIEATPGFISLDLLRCRETPNRYLFHIHWKTVEDHMVGFRESSRFQLWREMLNPFYETTPVMEHYSVVPTA
jgi:heme-degrading monooxygenase HmoA